MSCRRVASATLAARPALAPQAGHPGQRPAV